MKTILYDKKNGQFKLPVWSGIAIKEIHTMIGGRLIACGKVEPDKIPEPWNDTGHIYHYLETQYKERALTVKSIWMDNGTVVECIFLNDNDAWKMKYGPGDWRPTSNPEAVAS